MKDYFLKYACKCNDNVAILDNSDAKISMLQTTGSWLASKNAGNGSSRINPCSGRGVQGLTDREEIMKD